MKSAFETRLACELALALLVLGAAGVNSYRASRGFAEAGRAVSQRQEILRELGGVLSAVKDAENGVLAFRLSGEANEVLPLSAASSDIRERLSRTIGLASDNARRQAQIRALQQQVEAKLDDVRKAAESESPVQSQKIGRIKEIQAAISAVSDEETEALRRDSEALKSQARWASSSLLTMAALTCGFLFIVFFRLVRDVRERRRSTELLRYSEERYRLLAEGSLELVALLNLDGDLIYASPSHERVLGYAPSQLLGTNLTVIVHPDDVAAVRSAVAHLPESGPGKAIDSRLRKESGEWLDAELLLSSFSISGVVGRRILLSARDVSERKRAQKERENLIQELQEAVTKIKVLSGFIPICSSCKKIRDDEGCWNQLEIYIQNHSEAQFSHGICPDCAAVLYPGIFTKGA